MKLNEKAMLTELNISQCTFRKLDKTVTNEINNIHSAKRAAGNYNKATLAKEDLARIVRAVGNARTTFYQLTLPWSDKGPRILPAKLYWEYTTKMRACQSDFEIAVEDFFANYAQFQANAKQILGTMYKDEDYPTETKARLKFNFKTSITPLPDATDFRVDINTAEIDKIKAEYEASSRTMPNVLHSRV